MSARTIEQVLNVYAPQWMAVPSVEGTAVGLLEGKPCIKIFVSSDPQQLSVKIPADIEGYPVIIEKTGKFRPLNQQ